MINPMDTTTPTYSLQSSKLENLSQNTKGKSDAELKKAACGFEAVFINQFLNTMESTVDKSGGLLSEGKVEQTFRPMINEQIANSISSNPSTSFGLAETIYKQMKGKT